MRVSHKTFSREAKRRSKRPPRLLVVLALSLVAAVEARAQTANTHLSQPFTMRDDFQGDGLGQWASYPPVQDIGYDPSLSPTKEWDAPGGRALMRVARPTRAGGLRFGFIKKVVMSAGAGSRLSFAYRLNVNAAPDGAIEIGLAGGDGRRYLARVQARANMWATVELPLRDLRDAAGRPPPPGAGGAAIYLVSEVPHP